MSVTCMIPTYNEGETIQKVLRNLKTHLGPQLHHIVIVDDGSEDNTVSICEEMRKEFGANPVIHVSGDGHRGMGVTIRTGLIIAANLPRTRWTLKVDGDDQHDLSLAPRLIEILEQENAELVVASRFHPDALIHEAPIDRVLLNRTMSMILANITNWTLTDVRSGFLAASARLLGEIAEFMITKEYGAPMEILLRLWKKYPNARVVEIPHHPRYRNVSSKLEEKYRGEDTATQAHRLAVAYQVVLDVLKSLGIQKI